MYNVYILQSLKNGRYYIGQTDNLNDRLERHNQGRVKSTQYFRPWKIIYTEQFKNRAEAMRREKEIKNYKSGIKFKKLLGLWQDKDGGVA